MVPMAVNPAYEKLPLIQRADVPFRPEKMIFICGLHRSGTTVLEHWLHSHFELSVLCGPVPENEGQHLQDLLPADYRHGGAGVFAHAAKMRPKVPWFWQAPLLRQELLRLWTPWIVGESPVLLEKSPPNILRIRWLRAVFPGSGFILLTRHPVVTALATRKWQRKSVEAQLRHWQVAHGKALEDWGADCLHLRYEDFCADPERALASCGKVFGLRVRQEALSLAERFARLQDSNAKYLAKPGLASLGPGIWESLGYPAGAANA